MENYSLGRQVEEKAWAAWQLQLSPTACGTLRKHVTKSLTQPAAPDCSKHKIGFKYPFNGAKMLN